MFWKLMKPSVGIPLLVLLAGIAAAAANDGQWCHQTGDQLADQQKWTEAWQAYKDCSSSHDNSGPQAAWAMFQAYHVLYYQLRDLTAAAEACTKGFEAYNSAELAWCAAFVYSYVPDYKLSKQWAEKAISLGCFQGSCQSIAALLPNVGGNIPGCSWELPYNVLYWVSKGLKDEAGEEEAYRREYQAKYARKEWASYRDLYLQTRGDVSVPRGPALTDPASCGKRTLPARPIPQGHYEPQLHVVTFATDLNRKELDELVSSAKAFGVRVTVLQPRFDLRGHWGGRFGLRLQLVTNFANLIPDDDIIMFVDGYDVIFTGNASSIIDGYYRATKGKDIALFAAETGVWPERGLESSYPPGPTRYKFVNGGTWMGTAHAVRCVMSAIHLDFDDHGFLFTDDQWVFANAFIKTNKSPNPIIALDYNVDVFGSLYDRLQGGFSSFRPNDWECVEGKGWIHKPTGGVPKLYHASGNQGQPWMQRVILPYALRSGALGRPAPCNPNAVIHTAMPVPVNSSRASQAPPSLSIGAPSDSRPTQQAGLNMSFNASAAPPKDPKRLAPGVYPPTSQERHHATHLDLTLQGLIAAFGLVSFALTAAFARCRRSSLAKRHAYESLSGSPPTAAAAVVNISLLKQSAD